MDWGAACLLANLGAVHGVLKPLELEDQHIGCALDGDGFLRANQAPLLWALVLVLAVQHLSLGVALQCMLQAACAADVQSYVEERLHRVALEAALAALDLQHLALQELQL